MLFNLGSALIDLVVLLGLVVVTGAVWAWLWSGTPSTRIAWTPRIRGRLALGGLLGLALAALASSYTVSSRVAALPVLPVVGCALLAVVVVQLVAGPQPAVEAQAVLAAATVLVLLGCLFQTRLGTSPGLAIPLAALAVLALCSRPGVVRSLENPLVHRASGVAALACFSLPALARQQVQDAYVAVSVPVAGSVQPQELGRVLLVVWLAGSLAHRRSALLNLDRWWAGIPVPDLRLALTAVLPAVLGVGIGVLSNDYGPALVVAVVTTVLLAIAGAKRRYFVTAGLAGALACAAVVATVPKVADRVDAFWHPLPDGHGGPLGQVGAGLVALAHGGFTGLGLGRGMPQTVPAVHTDLVLAGLGEEIGGLGVLCTLLLLLLVGVGALRIARTADRDAETLLAAGLGAMVLGQTLLVAGGVLGLLPLTGMPVPLLSTSGSSLVSSAAALGLVVAVSRSGGRAPAPARALRTRLTVATLAAAVAMAVTGAVTLAYAAQPHRVLDRTVAVDPYRARLAMLNRGQITTRDGKVLAATAPRDAGHALRPDNAVRVYPGGATYAALVGHTSAIGTDTGIEAAQTDRLRCHDDRRLTGHWCPTLRLTVDSRIQQAAVSALGDRTGAVVAVDLRTGAVRAYLSWPATDPAPYGDPTRRVAGDVTPDLVIGSTTFPGSVAKLAVGIAGLERDVELLAAPLAELIIGGGTISSLTGAPCGGTGIADALSVSCNPEFAHIGAELGATGLDEGTRAILNQQHELDGLPVAPSRLVHPDASVFLAAAGGIGMGDAQVTPFAINQLTAQIARGGRPLTYHVVDGGSGEEARGPVLDHNVVAEIQAGMRQTVTSGTASSVPGLVALRAAAKTGTADFAPGLNNAWVTAYAPYDSPRFAVTVVVEPGQDRTQGLVGGRDAGPVVAAVLQACERWAR